MDALVKVTVTRALQQQIETMKPHLQQEVLNMFNFYAAEYKRLLKQHPADAVAANFGELITQIHEADPNRAQVSCKRGCSFCCHISVDITEHEAMALKAAIKEDNIEIDMQRLERQKNHDLSNWQQMPYADRACVFLGPEGECRVYDNRPGNCRNHQVISDPQLCNADRYPNGQITLSSDIQCEVITSVLMNCSETGTMPVMLLKQLSQ